MLSAHPQVVGSQICADVLLICLQSISVLKSTKHHMTLVDRLTTAVQSTILPKASAEQAHSIWSQLTEAERATISELNLFA